MEHRRDRVAIVTGSNKGIGYGIVRGLCKQFNGVVYLTARDVSRGHEAISKLEGEGHKPRFHQLDILDEASICRLAKYMKETYGGIDILVNNVGIANSNSSTSTVSEQAVVTMTTNYWATMAVCDALFPLLKPGARVVHLSSLLCASAYKQCSPEVKHVLSAATTTTEIGHCMHTFVQCAISDNLKGWPSASYGISKVGISLITPIQQKIFDDSHSDIVVNCCCPGYVATDINNFSGHKSIDEGADTPVYLSLLPSETDIRGQLVSGRKIKNWKK